MIRPVFLVACVVALSTVALVANRPQPLSLVQGVTGGGQLNYQIDKQSWWLDGTHVDPDHRIVNPLAGCTWDINDHNEYEARGVLIAGSSVNRTDCHVFDTNPFYACNSGTCAWWSGPSNWVGLEGWSTSSALIATLCFQPQNRCFTATPIYVGGSAKLYRYDACVQAVYDPTDASIVEIAGSNGGRGLVTTVRRSVTNPTARDVKSVQVNWGLASDVFTTPGCPAYPLSTWAIQSEYPWRWVVY